MAALEGLSGELAVAHVTDADVADLRALQDEMEQAHARRDLPNYYRVNRTIHDRLNAIAGHPVLTRSIRRFRAAAPDVEITLLPMVTSQQIEALRASQVDAGFLFHRHLDAREFAWREMSRETSLI